MMSQCSGWWLGLPLLALAFMAAICAGSTFCNGKRVISETPHLNAWVSQHGTTHGHTSAMLLVVCMTSAASSSVAQLPESDGLNGLSLCFPCNLATSPYESWVVVLQGRLIASQKWMLFDCSQSPAMAASAHS